MGRNQAKPGTGMKPHVRDAARLTECAPEIKLEGIIYMTKHNNSPKASDDTLALTVEVTEEMIVAGVEVLEEYGNYLGAEALASRVYTAMKLESCRANLR